jgi:hypothetical protein
MYVSKEKIYETYNKLKFYNFSLDNSKLNKEDINNMISFFINIDEFEKVLILQRFLQDY